ncbi:MAG: LD-carboxypeptidase [Myxococcales bacterium]|nr:LD-carboxypeptidase [Myxococcales bacterium]
MTAGVRPAAIEWIVPPAVRPRDVVAICAPAGPIRAARFERGLALLGPHLNLRLGDDVTAEAGYLAGDDGRRADELARALRDPDVRAIVVARGGYGLTRILADLDPALLRADPKPIVGFSDATALLAWAAVAGVRAIHGPVVSQLGDLPATDVAALVAALTDPRPLGTLPDPLAALGLSRPIAGPLVPGNLTLLAHLVGTPWQLDLTDAVALIEEVDEKPYMLDRDLTQLHLAGLLDGARGVILGDLTRCTDPPHARGVIDDPGPARAAVADRLARFGVAGWWGAPIGHGPRNLAVPMGARVEVDAAGRVAILDAAVR